MAFSGSPYLSSLNMNSKRAAVAAWRLPRPSLGDTRGNTSREHRSAHLTSLSNGHGRLHFKNPASPQKRVFLRIGGRKCSATWQMAPSNFFCFLTFVFSALSGVSYLVSLESADSSQLLKQKSSLKKHLSASNGKSMFISLQAVELEVKFC